MFHKMIISKAGIDYGKTEKDGIFKLLRSPGIDSKESIPPAYVATELVFVNL
jgi:hypothetical protein